MVVLPQFDLQWHLFEGQPDAVMRMRVAEELRRIDGEGAPLITAVLTIPDDRVQQTALERLRENDDGDGKQIYQSREWRLRIVEGGVPPLADAQGRPLPDAQRGKMLAAKVGVLGNHLGPEADSREVMRWGAVNRQNTDHAGRDLYRYVRITHQWTNVSTFDDAVAVLRQWGVGVAKKQWRRGAAWTPGTQSTDRGQLNWLVEEWSPTRAYDAPKAEPRGKAA